jgi:hypothetical protein
MEIKHTPGPWEVRSDDSGQHHWITPVVGGGYGCAGDRYMAVSGCIDVNDARLIAAAPDLLAALQGVVRVADRATDEFDAARAAIAKATGSES